MYPTTEEFELQNTPSGKLWEAKKEEFLQKGIKEAMRFNEGKLQWSLVDFKALEPMVRVLEYGAKKYEPDNWKKGLPENKVIESLLRHVFALLQGEDTDEESGCEHTGHILCNAMFLSHFRQRQKVSQLIEDKTS